MPLSILNAKITCPYEWRQLHSVCLQNIFCLLNPPFEKRIKLVKIIYILHGFPMCVRNSTRPNPLCPPHRDLADNKVFFQHPDLMRALGIHETVMSLMVNTLSKAAQQTDAVVVDPSQKRRSSVISNQPDLVESDANKVSN